MRGSDIKDPADLRCDASVTERDDGNVSPYVAHFRYCTVFEQLLVRVCRGR